MGIDQRWDQSVLHREETMSECSEYAPSPWDWVRNQVEEYEASGGQRGNTLLDTGMPIILLRTKGATTGAIRKTPLMRVEHDGEYALVAHPSTRSGTTTCWRIRSTCASRMDLNRSTWWSAR
jgi:hypothetical protein